MSQEKPLAKSICLGACSTSYGDAVCRGCGRSEQDIAACHHGDDQSGMDVVYKLAALADASRSKRLRISDRDGMRSFLDEHKQGGFASVSLWFGVLRWYVQCQRRETEIACPLIEVMPGCDLVKELEAWRVTFYQLAKSKYLQQDARSILAQARTGT